MIPVVPALVLAIVSFLSSAFIVLRIIIPILPPHPLSKRVSPSEFGLPTFRSLSPSDKAHLWLASLDLVALGLFVWQIIDESTNGPSGPAIATDPAAAVRLWLIVTVRQTCLLILAGITLLHVRLAQSVSFGSKHWLIWGPMSLLVITSTAVAGVLAGSQVNTLFLGLTAYSASIAVAATVVIGCLIRTLFVIKKNLNPIHDVNDSWPPVKQTEDKPRPSFATEDIDALRDGASWITSNPGSRRNSVSAWSFSTHHTVTTSHHAPVPGRPQNVNHGSVPAKSSFWFGSATHNDIQVPPVPPLPSPYGPLSPTSAGLAEADPFRRDLPLPPLPGQQQKSRMGSQSSWLTSSDGSHTTLTAWSYPTTHEAPKVEGTGTLVPSSTPDYQRTAYSPSPSPSPRPYTPGLADAQVLGGYGYSRHASETGLTSLAASGTSVEISLAPAIGWSVSIWLPISFSLPYLIFNSAQIPPSAAIEILFILSITLSAPLLAINIVAGSPLPVPTGLFDAPVGNSLPNPSAIHIGGGSTLPPRWSSDYKRCGTSCSMTVVEGRRSGDVWLTKGDAVDGKGKLGRAVTMLQPTPKLSVLPPEEDDDALDMPPVPFANDDSLPVNVHGTPNSDMSVQFGRMKSSRSNSHHYSNGDDSMAYATRIMVAERHYSALAQTMVVPGSNGAGNRDSAGASTLVSSATGTTRNKRVSHNSHLRSRSISSLAPPDAATHVTDPSPSPPPMHPLPPTPPPRSVHMALLAHKKSFSSGYSLHEREIDDLHEIDAMTAGVLPLLVPGLNIGEDMKIKNGDYSPPGTWSKSKGMKAMKKLAEFGEDFSSPEVHSTPARYRGARARKESGHKKNHFSLPSLSLGKEGVQSLATWGSDIRNVLEQKVGQYATLSSQADVARRNTTEVPSDHQAALGSVQEEGGKHTTEVKLARSMSTRSLGLRADVPHDIDTARSSVASIVQMAPPSAASTVTLFEDFEAGLESPPQAESTPHNSVSQRRPSNRPAPPLPEKKEKRRSTIKYIKSDEPQANNMYTLQENVPAESETSPSAIAALTQWTSNAVRPLVSKSTNLKRTSSNSSQTKGLRQLTLLQDRGNIPASETQSQPSPKQMTEIRPLTLGKRQKSRNAVQDENAYTRPRASPSKNKNFKQLTLARSETTKQRAILRQTEVLPEVVIRPPSQSEHTAFAYNFYD
ncbi:hypothetical protein CVT24_000658 [Panaeolus cyanescens]|uniref:Uncharacterized protein n=1 Tax=Panaeolus cyanescens TaxID=181874 RepID=A0A409W761_9AGAR|nr:hypothetical protein CVT24_000658 [Panaeolus cyanescens]